MKLLLTSQGITNKSIEKKFFELVGKKPEDIVLCYIMTSVNLVSETNKWWMIDNLMKIKAMGIGQIDIMDFVSVPKDNWLPRLQASDVIFMEGGSAFGLLEAAKRAGLDKELPELLQSKVYVGASAGSMLLTKEEVTSDKADPSGFKHGKGLGIVDFSMRPHFYRPDRSTFTEELLAKFAKQYNTTFYGIDDDTAIVVTDGEIEIISEGKWKKFS